MKLARRMAWRMMIEKKISAMFSYDPEVGMKCNVNRVAGKLVGYVDLATAQGAGVLVLLWLPAPAREAALRPALARAPPDGVSVATATGARSAAGPVWLPLGSACRVSLSDLPPRPGVLN